MGLQGESIHLANAEERSCWPAGHTADWYWRRDSCDGCWRVIIVNMEGERSVSRQDPLRLFFHLWSYRFFFVWKVLEKYEK